ncbi:Uncharacterised protein [Mycobacteroides abscessus subsp. abscessus]|nr:Uncharacterised protein [Mycobacteroides abscessus subsp. abscessus]
MPHRVQAVVLGVYRIPLGAQPCGNGRTDRGFVVNDQDSSLAGHMNRLFDGCGDGWSLL